MDTPGVPKPEGETCPPPSSSSSSSPSLLYRIAKIYFIATFSPVIIPYYVTKTSINVAHLMVTAARAEKEEGQEEGLVGFAQRTVKYCWLSSKPYVREGLAMLGRDELLGTLDMQVKRLVGGGALALPAPEVVPEKDGVEEQKESFTLDRLPLEKLKTAPEPDLADIMFSPRGEEPDDLLLEPLKSPASIDTSEFASPLNTEDMHFLLATPDVKETSRLSPVPEKKAMVGEGAEGRLRVGSTRSLSTCSSFADEDKVVSTRTKRRSKTTRRRAPVDEFRPSSPRNDYETVTRTLKI